MPLSATLRQKLSGLAAAPAPSPAAGPQVSSTSATFVPTSIGPAKKRGLLAGWLRSSGLTAAAAGDDGGRPRTSSDVGSAGGGGKGKEREWDAGELDEEMRKVMNAVIFNGGLDYETRPLVVITAAALPDPNLVDYDLLLQLILSYLDLYVEADYCVVFLAAGGRYSPGWSWIWKAYRSLNRKYRKNLKKLYIVHSTGFTKMLLSLAGAIISPKFYSKIEYISTLSDLAAQVPLTQINVHPAVYSENLKHEREIRVPSTRSAAESLAFGVSLDDLMGADGEAGGVPRPIRDAIAFLRSERRRGDGNGRYASYLEEQGLFRRSPSSALLRQVIGAYDRGQTLELEQFADANLAAVLIKKFFRALPEPIFPDSTFAVIRKCPNPDIPANHDDAIAYIKERVLGDLPGNKQILLNVVFQLLHDVAVRSSYNLMDAYNLAIVFTPNLVSNENPLRAVQISMVSSPMPGSRRSKDIMELAPPSSPSSARRGQAKAVNLPDGHPAGNGSNGGTTLGTIVRFCIESYYEIFDEVRDVTEAVPEDAAFDDGRSSTKDVEDPPSSSSPSSSPKILTPPNSRPAPISNASNNAFASRKGSSSESATSVPTTGGMKYHQPRVRGHAGPPPSALSPSMAMLAKALADGTPAGPEEERSLLQDVDRNPSSSLASGGHGTLRDLPDQYYYGSPSSSTLSPDAGALSVSVRSGNNGSAARSRSGWTGGRGLLGMPKTRSILSIEKSPPTVTLGGSGDKSYSATVTGKESIRLGRGSGGTVRKSASAGVMGVGVTATGFFTSPS